MHELALCERVLRVIEAEAAVHGFTRVSRVCLELGDLAAVEVEAMRFGFEVVKAGSLAAQAALEIERIAGAAWCEACRAEVAVSRRFDACARCGGYPLALTRGDEMRIKALEVE